MEMQKFKTILAVGETAAVEFKRCGNGVSADTYETLCSFLNRYGGDIFLGVENDGTVIGLPVNAISDVIKNFISMISNPDMLSPAVYLSPDILQYEGKQVVHIHVPPLSDHPQATQVETAKAIGKSRRTVQDAIALLKENGLLERQGARKKGRWIVSQKI